MQEIIIKDLSDKMLEWKGIDATEKLAASANAKVIIVGSGENGLPVILHTGGAGAGPDSITNARNSH